MSTSAKSGIQKSAKKTGCRFVQVISNDRAEAFLNPQPEVCPRDSEAPCARDKRAHALMSKGWTQRRIAARLGCSQPTVQRAIKRYRLWFGTTLPEDRGEITGFARYRIAVEEHRIFLEHQKQLAMQEWRRSRKSVRKQGGKKAAENQTDQQLQKRNANVSHFNAATRLSLQLTMLQAGYLGVHRLACDQALDIDGLDRWDRMVKSRDRVIEELTREVAELKAQLQSTLHAPREVLLTRSVRSTILDPPEEKRPRWDDAARQEALDYHCMIHGIPPLELHQVTGIPDPKTISPKMWMQRGYPYMIYSDRSIPSKRDPVRDTRKVITVW